MDLGANVHGSRFPPGPRTLVLRCDLLFCPTRNLGPSPLARSHATWWLPSIFPAPSVLFNSHPSPASTDFCFGLATSPFGLRDSLLHSFFLLTPFLSHFCASFRLYQTSLPQHFSQRWTKPLTHPDFDVCCLPKTEPFRNANLVALLFAFARLSVSIPTRPRFSFAWPRVFPVPARSTARPPAAILRLGIRRQQ